jgi:hypothetical protein
MRSPFPSGLAHFGHHVWDCSVAGLPVIRFFRTFVHASFMTFVVRGGLCWAAESFDRIVSLG